MLILRKQCYAFIHTVGLSDELEVVVKDLWALRLQLLVKKVDATSDDETMFSSQPESETKDGGVGTRFREWKVKGKPMPRLIDTLGLCYLGAVILKLSISLGDIHR